MASENVSPETVSKAVDALLKWRRSQSETQKPKLFDEDEEFVYLILTLKKIPSKSRVNPHKIPLPHSLISPFSEQCLILDDRPNKARVTKAQAQAKIQSESIPVHKVLKLSKLASDYRPFEAKRKLCDSYDLFFAEKSIVPLLPRLLGKSFFKKRKIPVPVDLKKGSWKEQVERACSSAMLFMRTGTCSVVRVAKVRMERDEIVENIVAAIEGIVEVVPKKWGNVRSLHLKLLESLALPVYQTVPDVRLKIEGFNVEEETATTTRRTKKKKNEKEKEGEVSDSIEGGTEKKKKKKGRIHEVRYMDENVVEDGMLDELVSDDDDSEDEMVNKKRKKGVSSELSGVEQLKKLVFNELSAKGKKKSKKGLSVGKGVKGGLIEGSGSELVVKDEVSGVKKKKRGDVKATKSVKATKGVKAKKIKKAV